MYEIPGKLLGHREKQGVTDPGHVSVRQSDNREGVDYVEWWHRNSDQMHLQTQAQRPEKYKHG